MNFLKVNLTYPGGMFTYNSYFVPRVGESIVFSSPAINGTVTKVTWNHVNEVTLLVKTY